MLSKLDWISIVRVSKVLTWEKSKLIFTNSSVICNCSSAKVIWKAKIAELRAIFDI